MSAARDDGRGSGCAACLSATNRESVNGSPPQVRGKPYRAGMRDSGRDRGVIAPDSFWWLFVAVAGAAGSVATGNAIVMAVLAVAATVSIRRGTPYRPALLVCAGVWMTTLTVAQNGVLPWLMVSLGVSRLSRTDPRFNRVLLISLATVAVSAAAVLESGAVAVDSNVNNPPRLPGQPAWELTYGALSIIATVAIFAVLARRSGEVGDHPLGEKLRRIGVVATAARVIAVAVTVGFAGTGRRVPHTGAAGFILAVFVFTPMVVMTFRSLRPLWHAAEAPWLQGAVGRRRASRLARASAAPQVANSFDPAQ